MSQSSAVVLPVLTVQKTFVWVRSEQIDLQVVGAAELQEAFDAFPYPTSQEMAALAQRCSLHPDQVNVWFMTQRLRYGISWENEDIRNVREMLMQSGRRETKDGEEEEDVAAKMMKKKRTEKKSVGKEDNSKVSGETKQNMEKVADKVGKARARQDSYDPLQTKKRKMKAASNQDLFVVQVEKQTSDTSSVADSVTGLLKSMNLSTAPGNSGKTSDQEKSKTEAALENKAMDVGGGLDVSDGPSTSAQQPKSGSCSPLTHRNAKTLRRMSMMRTAFLQCQYPDPERYSQLAEDIGISRKLLVQWFNNVRCYIKKSKPRWMSVKQHRQVLAAVRYRQYMSIFQSYQHVSGVAQEDQGLFRGRK